MANEKAEDQSEDDILSAFSSDSPADGEADPALDEAIGGLQGVLQNDAEGTVPDLDDMIGGGDDLSEFGGDFGAETGGGDFGSDLGGDFGGGDFGGGDFGGGGADFGGGDFGDESELSVAPPGSALHANHDLIMDIPIDVQIVLGTSHMNVANLMNLSEGATIALDRKIGEPVEILVNGRMIGRGEITVLDEDNTRFGVKLLEIMKVQKKS